MPPKRDTSYTKDDVLNARITRLEDQVKQLLSNKVLTAPIYNSGHFPVGAVQGQVVIANASPSISNLVWENSVDPLPLTVYDINNDRLMSGYFFGGTVGPGYYNYDTEAETRVTNIADVVYPTNPTINIAYINDLDEWVLTHPNEPVSNSRYPSNPNAFWGFTTFTRRGLQNDMNDAGDVLYWLTAVGTLSQFGAKLFINLKENYIYSTATYTFDPGIEYSWNRINNLGHVVHNLNKNTSSPSTDCEAQFWNGTTTVPFPLGGFSIAYDMNDSDMIVGTYTPTDTVRTVRPQAFIWNGQTGEVRLFADNLDAGFETQNQFGFGINNRGHVTFVVDQSNGSGWDSADNDFRPYLWSSTSNQFSRITTPNESESWVVGRVNDADVTWVQQVFGSTLCYTARPV